MKKERLLPFDLEKAKNGAKVKTVNGHNARIMAFDRKGNKPIVALITLDDGTEIAQYYTLTGKFKDDNISYQDNLQIVEEIEVPDRWRDNTSAKFNGYYIVNSGAINFMTDFENKEDDYNKFNTEAQAKSALAAARISILIANDKRFGGVVTDKEWKSCKSITTIIHLYDGKIEVFDDAGIRTILAFHTKEQADLFLSENMDLVKQYFMV